MSIDPTAYPYNSIVYITDTIGVNRYQATGVLIAPDEVLTATHVVYSSTDGTATAIRVTPAYQPGSAPFGTYSGTTIHYFNISNANDQIALSDSPFDYAVIHLSHPVIGDGTMGYASNFPGGAVHVTGYPASQAGQLVDSQQTVTVDSSYALLDGTSLGPGSSGGPVWTTVGGQPYVVGLVSGSIGTTGYFVQVTQSVHDQIQRWVALDDGANSPGTSANPVTFVVHPDGAAVARLYVAAFARQPDSAGLTYWTNLYQATVPAADRAANLVAALAADPAGPGGPPVATQFVTSAEFTGKYGALSDAAFVTQIYQNALSRTPDQAGLNYWVNTIETSHDGRAVMLVGIAESPEGVANANHWLAIV